MFKLKKIESVWWTVKINMPVDGGDTKEIKCQMQFKYLEQDALDKAMKKKDSELLKDVVLDWKEVGDETGNELPFSEENLSAMTNIPYVRVAMVNAFNHMTMGAKTKN